MVKHVTISPEEAADLQWDRGPTDQTTERDERNFPRAQSPSVIAQFLYSRKWQCPFEWLAGSCPSRRLAS
jgi:hypothetical protein